MMILQAVSEDHRLLQEIADDLLKANLLANAIISKNSNYRYLTHQGAIVESSTHILKGISKSLLFSKINKKLRSKYGDKMPLLYSEPIIMIDPHQMEVFLDRLIEV